jgi:hypothetical protein
MRLLKFYRKTETTILDLAAQDESLVTQKEDIDNECGTEVVSLETSGPYGTGST